MNLPGIQSHRSAAAEALQNILLEEGAVAWPGNEQKWPDSSRVS